MNLIFFFSQGNYNKHETVVCATKAITFMAKPVEVYTFLGVIKASSVYIYIYLYTT